MFINVVAVLVIISVSYVLSVFLAPSQADELAKVLGIAEFNTQVRDFKQTIDSTDSITKFKDQSGSLVDGSILESAKSDIDAARMQAEKLRGVIQDKQNIIENKVQQANQIVETANSLKTQINTFTTLTWATSTGTVTTGASGSTLSGGIDSLPTSVPNR